MKKLFITSTGTEIGKTLVTTALCWQLVKQNQKVTALKPMMSGAELGDSECDAGLILQSLGQNTDDAAIADITPWRYKAALAPNMAAAIEGNPIELEALMTFCHQKMQQNSDVMLIEGVGGIMAPINNQYTILDWMKKLSFPALLVTGSYLGSISHTLSAVEVLRSHDIAINGIIVSESEDSGVTLDDTLSTLEKFLPAAIPVISIKRFPAQQALWKCVPPLTGLV